MTINIDISPQAEANLSRLAKQQGIDPAMLVGKVLEERFASTSEASPANSDAISAPVLDPKAEAAIAWLNQRIAEDATDDPEEIRVADAEVAELKRNLNENRVEYRVVQHNAFLSVQKVVAQCSGLFKDRAGV